MGLSIDRETFSQTDYELFAARLNQSLTVLRDLLNRPGFGDGPATLDMAANAAVRVRAGNAGFWITWNNASRDGKRSRTCWTNTWNKRPAAVPWENGRCPIE